MANQSQVNLSRSEWKWIQRCKYWEAEGGGARPTDSAGRTLCDRLVRKGILYFVADGPGMDDDDDAMLPVYNLTDAGVALLSEVAE